MQLSALDTLRKRDRENTISLDAVKNSEVFESQTECGPEEQKRTLLDELAERELPQVIKRIFQEDVLPRERRIWEMWIDGIPWEQITNELEIPDSTARRNWRSVRTILRNRLQELGWSIP